MPQDGCVFECTPFEDKPPLCLGMCANDFVHFSESNQVEEWLGQQLSACLEVNFMGPASWFLGCHSDWHFLKDERLTCHISQQAFIEQLFLEKFNMENCVGSRRLFKRGLPINRVDREQTPQTNHDQFVERCQSLMGGLVWLVCGTPIGV